MFTQIQSIIQQLQTNILLQKQSTGYWLVDMIMIPILIGMLGNFLTSYSDYISTIKSYIKRFFNQESKYCAKMDFEGTIIRSYWKTRVELDIGMIAIFHYIFNHLSKIRGIKHFKRIPDRSLNDDYVSENSTKKNIVSLNLFEEFFIVQHTKISLDDDIYIIPDVYDQSEETVDNKNKTGKTTSYNITLMCDKYKSIDDNMQYLIKFYRALCIQYNEFKELDQDNNRYIYTYDNTHENNIYFNRFSITKEPKTMDHVFFPGKDEFIRDLDFFFNHKEFYIKKGKPYRKIILSHGEPGCGKTSLLLALLDYTSRNENRHLIHLKLDKLTKKDLNNILFKETIKVNGLFEGSKKIPFHQRIYCIEEIDNYSATHTRKSKRKENSSNINSKNIIKEEIMKELNITSDTTKIGPEKQNDVYVGIQDLLEAFDGVPSLKSGEIVYMTTNHIDKIDPALKRPGRVNHLMEFRKCTKQMVIDIMEQYYESSFPEEKKTTLIDEQWTPAYVESICDSRDTIESAIHLLYSKI